MGGKCNEHYTVARKEAVNEGQKGVANGSGGSGNSSSSRSGTARPVTNSDGSSTEDEIDALQSAAATTAAAAVRSASSSASNSQTIVPGMNVLIGKGLGDK